MRRLLILMGMASLTMAGHAQIDTRELHRAFDEFRSDIREDFGNFRQEIMAEYIEFLSDPWKEFQAEQPIEQPKEEPVPPVVMPEEDQNKPVEDTPVVVEDTVAPVLVNPQPAPVAPIEEVPVIEEKTVQLSFYGTPLKFRFAGNQSFQLNNLKEKTVANALKVLSSEEYDNLIYDCLKAREERQLCDWAYLLLLKSVSEKLCGKETNEAVLLCAYLYLSSGYRMRLAEDGQRLYMLYASRHVIYNIASYSLDGEIYYGLEDLPARLRISEAAFRNEQNMSLLMTQQIRLGAKLSAVRSVKSKAFPSLAVTSQVNENLIDFYATYPTSYYADDMMTRWAIYANTPMDSVTQSQIYPAIRVCLAGCNELEAANRLLNWVQTGFEYEYDDKVWGGDRAFFAEETLYYPYCDCEDRAILYSRLVRDLLGLDVVLVYYPGHLATAVAFRDDVHGDYLIVDGRRFVIADPTYIGASVGRSMPGLDNGGVKAIRL